MASRSWRHSAAPGRWAENARAPVVSGAFALLSVENPEQPKASSQIKQMVGRAVARDCRISQSWWRRSLTVLCSCGSVLSHRREVASRFCEDSTRHKCARQVHRQSFCKRPFTVVNLYFLTGHTLWAAAAWILATTMSLRVCSTRSSSLGTGLWERLRLRCASRTTSSTRGTLISDPCLDE